MVDAKLREQLADTFTFIARVIDRPGISPDSITTAGLVLGMGGAISAWKHLWPVALAFWLLSRIADGMDGALARRRVGQGEKVNSAGGYLDIMADFVVYGSFVVGVAHGAEQGYLPFIFVLLAYYLNGTAFLAFSSIGEKVGIRLDDGRSLSFIYGLAEATETIVVHSAWCIFPSQASHIASGWAAVVLTSAALRFYHSQNLLKKGV